MGHSSPAGIHPLDLSHVLVGRQSLQDPTSTSSYSRAPSEAGYLCPFCNASYSSGKAFKQHMLFHENEAVKEERTRMLNEMVAASFSKSRATILTRCYDIAT